MNEDREDSAIKALLGNDSEAAELAASELGDLPRPSLRTLAALLRVSFEGCDDAVRIGALRAFARLARQPRHRQPPKRQGTSGLDLSVTTSLLIQAAWLDKAPDVRAAALNAAAETGDRKLARQLAEVGRLDPDEWVQTTADAILKKLAREREKKV